MLRARPRRAPPEAGKGKEQPSPGERGSDALPSPAHGAKAAGTPREGTGGDRRLKRAPLTVDAGLVSHGSARFRSARFRSPPLRLRRVPGRKRLGRQHRPLPE